MTRGVVAIVAVALLCAAAWFLLKEDDAPSADPGFEPKTSSTAPKPADPSRGPKPAPPIDAPKAAPIASSTYDAALIRGVATFRGYVVDETGAPIENAVVALRHDASGVDSTILEGALIASRTTDRNGAYSFDEDAAAEVRERFLLTASHEAYAVERLGPIEGREATGYRADFVLRVLGGEVSGVVTDEAGTPLLGARVDVVDLSIQSKTPGGAVEKTVLSTEAGEFHAPSLRPGMKSLQISLKGYTRAGVAMFDLREGVKARFEFRLGRARKIDGRIVAVDTGAGLKGAIVTAKLLRLESPKDAAPPTDDTSRKPPTSEDDGADARVQKAIDDEDGAEASKATRDVELRDMAERRKVPHVFATSGDDGAFVLEGLEAGYYEVDVKAPGYFDPPKQTTASDAFLNFSASPKGRVAGTVVDAETGAPIPEFTIGVVSAGAGQAFAPWQTIRRFGSAASRDGAFVYDDLVSARFQLVVEARGYAQGRSEEFQVGPGERREGMIIRMTRGATVRGRVVDASGKPILNAVARLEAPSTGGFLDALTRGMRRERRTARTDAEGRYVFPHVAEGTWTVKASHERFAEAAVDGVLVPKSGETTAPDLALPRGGVIRGRVLRASDGAPDANATVRVVRVATGGAPSPFGGPSLGGGDPGKEASTDADGRFEIGGLIPGDYRTLVVKREGNPDFRDIFGFLPGNVPGGALRATPTSSAPPTPRPTHRLEDGGETDVGDL